MGLGPPGIDGGRDAGTHEGRSHTQTRSAEGPSRPAPDDRQRAVSTIVAVLVLIATTVIVAGVTSGYFIDFAEKLGEPDDADPAPSTPTPTETCTPTPAGTATFPPTPSPSPTPGVGTSSPTATSTVEPC